LRHKSRFGFNVRRAPRTMVSETDMNAEWQHHRTRAAAEAPSVFSRVGWPEDVADVIAFLASNDARWTTGQMVDATGGARI
jgi:3-oxoacyl-[acyl-carrier protein] reductase